MECIQICKVIRFYLSLIVIHKEKKCEQHIHKKNEQIFTTYGSLHKDKFSKIKLIIRNTDPAINRAIQCHPNMAKENGLMYTSMLNVRRMSAENWLVNKRTIASLRQNGGNIRKIYDKTL